MAIAGVLILSFLAGAIGQYIHPGDDRTPVDLWASVCVAICTFIWYQTDAEERSFKRSVILDLGVLGITVLFLPYYLLRSRGFLRGILATAAYIVLLAASMLLRMIGPYATYYTLQA